MATGVTIEFSGDDDEDRKRTTPKQPASKKGQAEGVSSRKPKPVAEPSRAELVQQAKDLGIRGYSAMNKTQLQDAINLKLKPPKAAKSTARKYGKFTIEKVDSDGYKAWNIFDADGNIVDAADTLEGAKRLAKNISDKAAKPKTKSVKPRKPKVSETYIPEGTAIDDSFDFGANVKPSSPVAPPTTLFDQNAESFSPLPEPSKQSAPVEPSPLFDQTAIEFTPLPEPTGIPAFVPGKTLDLEPEGITKTPISKEQKRLEAKAKKEKNLQDRSSLSQMQRRANVQNSIQKRRETLQRRREREAITEDARNAKSEIQDRYDRGDADRLVRRLATFGIGRAVGIDGGLITALAEIMIFQPEINKAEAEVAALLKNADRVAAERMQELERSKTATTERRQIQSIDVAETIDDARQRVAMGEDVDMGEVEDRIGSILNRGVVDPGTGIPTPRTGQQAGPGASVFPTTSQFTAPAQSGAAGTPPPPFVGGAGGMNPPRPPGGSPGANFGGFGGPPGRGGSPPPGMAGGGAGPGGLAMTTSSLLMLTVALTAAAKASQIAADGFKSIGELVQDEKNIGKAVSMAGSSASAVTTGIATGAGFLSGGPAGALAGLVFGKAIGTVLIGPVTEAISTGFDVLSSAADKSTAPQTINARATENIQLLLTQMEESFKLDDITSEFVSTRTEFAMAVMELKTSLIQFFGPEMMETVKALTTLIKIGESILNVFNTNEDGKPGYIRFSDFTPVYGGLMRLLAIIADNTEKPQTNTNILGPINDFFQGGRDSRASVQGSFATNIHPWDLTNNITSFNP